MSADLADAAVDGRAHDHAHSHDRPHSHDHPHALDHKHAHDHPAGDHGGEAGSESAPHGGPVLLDIGGDIGAVIARLDDDQEGTELPILALDDPGWDPRTHTGVWRRPIGGGTVVVAVYPELKRGRYRIAVPTGRRAEFDVVGGQVTELDLRVTTG
jgi:hypothetical protein